MSIPEQGSLAGMTPDDVETLELRERDFERRFGDYWATSNTAWGAERIQRTVIGIAKELMVLADKPTCEAQRVGALKSAGDLLMRMLNKHIPDLKSIDMTGNIGQSHEDALAQLAFRIRAEEEAAGQLPAVRSDVPQNTH
jgi:hypothetical protein